jgi:hypothetical protein
MKSVRLALPIVLVAALAFPIVAFAGGESAGESEGRVVLGGTYTLLSGKVLTGDLVVIGGAATLETDSTVEGDVALIGGFLNADGLIEGDVFAMGGIVTLGPEVVVEGDLVSIGAVVNRAEGAQVLGQVSDESWSTFDFRGPGVIVPEVVGVPGMMPLPWGGMSWFDPLASFGWALLRALLMAGLAVLVIMFWPERTARVGRALISQPAASGGIGLLTAFLGLLVIVILAFTICLIPFSLIGGLILGAAFIFGWIALGLEVGIRLAEAFKRDWHPATKAALGTLLLSFVAYAFGLIPCVGGIVPLVLSLIGLGAVTLTRFGGREAVSSAPPAGTPSV